MPGGPDPLYVLARSVLLDALEALGDQRKALVLVGAQAVYLHTGESDLVVAPFTTDADLAVDPARLDAEPELRAALGRAGLIAGSRPGSWFKEAPLDTRTVKVVVDLLVPEALAKGAGTRSADLGVHGRTTARRTRGLEAALVDRDPMTLAALEDRDPRHFEISVAGPAALIVVKLHKIQERVREPGRGRDKDALDILRLLRKVQTGELARRMALLRNHPQAGETAREALAALGTLFGTPAGLGSRMAARAAAPEPEDTIAASCAALATDLLRAAT